MSAWHKPQINQNPQSSLHEYWVDYLRCIACLQVVAIHTTAYQHDLLKSSILYTYLGYVIHMAINLFFIISGYVLIQKYVGRISSYTAYYKKRTRRVLWPYFSFSLLYISMRILIEHGGTYSLKTVEYVPFHMGQVLRNLLCAGAAMHLYFLVSIYILYLLFPLVRVICRNRWSSLSLLFIYCLLNPLLLNIYKGWGLNLPEPDMLRSAIVGMKYFLVGINLYWFRPIVWNFLEEWGMIIFIGFFVIAVYLRFYTPSSYNDLAAYSLILSYLILSIFLGKYRLQLVKWFSELTLGIYLIHQPILANIVNKMVRCLPRLIPPNVLLNPWGIQIIFFMSVVTASCIMIMIIKKLKVLNFLMFGECP